MRMGMQYNSKYTMGSDPYWHVIFKLTRYYFQALLLEKTTQEEPKIK